jgi:hypothetical protein
VFKWFGYDVLFHHEMQRGAGFGVADLVSQFEFHILAQKANIVTS